MKTVSERKEISFLFSPTSDPYFNGLVDADIKSVRNHLSNVIESQILTYEEFYTVLTLIESVLNSRPLSSDYEV